MDHYDFKDKNAKMEEIYRQFKKIIFHVWFLFLFKLHIYCISMEDYDYFILFLLLFAGCIHG